MYFVWHFDCVQGQSKRNCSITNSTLNGQLKLQQCHIPLFHFSCHAHQADPENEQYIWFSMKWSLLLNLLNFVLIITSLQVTSNSIVIVNLHFSLLSDSLNLYQAGTGIAELIALEISKQVWHLLLFMFSFVMVHL